MELTIDNKTDDMVSHAASNTSQPSTMVIDLANIDADVVHVLWAAMYSMTQDIHCPESCLTEDQWQTADAVFQALDNAVNERAQVKNGKNQTQA